MHLNKLESASKLISSLTRQSLLLPSLYSVNMLCTHRPRRWKCLIEDCCDHPTMAEEERRKGESRAERERERHCHTMDILPLAGNPQTWQCQFIYLGFYSIASKIFCYVCTNTLYLPFSSNKHAYI